MYTLLESLRVYAGLTQEELASRAKVPLSTVTLLELGQRRTDDHDLAA